MACIRWSPRRDWLPFASTERRSSPTLPWPPRAWLPPNLVARLSPASGPIARSRSPSPGSSSAHRSSASPPPVIHPGRPGTRTARGWRHGSPSVVARPSPVARPVKRSAPTEPTAPRPAMTRSRRTAGRHARGRRRYDRRVEFGQPPEVTKPSSPFAAVDFGDIESRRPTRRRSRDRSSTTERWSSRSPSIRPSPTEAAWSGPTRSRRGDKLTDIATEFKVSPMTIVWANNLKSKTDFKKGDTLRIPPVTGLDRQGRRDRHPRLDRRRATASMAPTSS